jgi:hypothetical protein
MRLFYRADPDAIAERASNPPPPKSAPAPKASRPKPPFNGLKVRCAWCKTKIKKRQFRYAIACHKCGRIQPWAQPVSDTPTP